jgi:hypothetical protein
VALIRPQLMFCSQAKSSESTPGLRPRSLPIRASHPELPTSRRQQKVSRRAQGQSAGSTHLRPSKKLCSYLGNMSKLLTDKEFLERDIDEVKCSLELFRGYAYVPTRKKGTEVFQPAVLARGYGSVIFLAQRLKLKPWMPPNAV